MLKKNGKSKPTKKFKCPNCGLVDISSEDIEEVCGTKIAICPTCFCDILLKKK